MSDISQSASRWTSEAFLDTLVALGDAEADACFAALPSDKSFSYLFRTMQSGAPLPAELPAALASYLRSPDALSISDLTEEDLARIDRGQRVFLTNALPMGLALLCKSLPQGYQAPRLSDVLMMTGELQTTTYRRVLGVLQMLLDVNQANSFRESHGDSSRFGRSDAMMTALRVRLMHAGIRAMAKKHIADFGERLGGVPVSLEDMLFTIIAFSLHVLQGVESVGIPLTAEEKEDYFFVWRVYARCMGIHPPNEPASWDFIPASVAEAETFNQTYSRRHFRQLVENPNAAPLADAQVQMIAQRLGFFLPRFMAPTFAPRMYIERMIGRAACVNIGVRPVSWLLAPLKAIVLDVPATWSSIWRMIDRLKGSSDWHMKKSRDFFQRLIMWQYNGAESFQVVHDTDDVKALVRGTEPGLDFGLQQFHESVFPTELGEIRRRREALGQDASPLDGGPSTERGLTGLSLSGGGIRSAAFSLGAVQALGETTTLSRVDYLSTVSGGGYMGGALSSALTEPTAGLSGKAFPFDFEPGKEEPPGVRQLRNGSNFLAGGDLMSEMRLPMIMVRGFLINGVLFLPYLMFAAWLTWLAYPFVHNQRIGTMIGFVTLATFLALMISYPAFSFLFGRNFTWSARDKYEKVQALSLLALVIVVLLGILSVPVESAIGSDWTSVGERIKQEFLHPFEARDAWKWAVILGIGGALVSAGKISKTLTRRANQIFIFVLGIVGPAIVFAAYLCLLVGFARSPNLPVKQAKTLEMMATHQRQQALPKGVRQLLDDLRIRDVDFDPSAPVLSVKPDSIWRIADVHDNWYTITRYPTYLEISDIGFGTRPGDWWFVGIALVVFILNGIWVDVNVSSAHGFYRDRLSKAFLFRCKRWFGGAEPNDAQKLSDLGSKNPVAPYHLINASLNLAGENVSDLPGRRSDFFVMSKRFVGSYATGYCATEEMERTDRRFDLGTAIAISGAAAAPNMGTMTKRSLTLILTLLNVRLGYWLPNPWFVSASSLVRRLAVKQRPGPNYLLREGLGLTNARTSFVNVSDGGHVENLGMFELLRRRCKVIIAVDAECDPGLACSALATLTRYARTDLGVEIDVDTSVLKPNDAGCVSCQCVTGTIHYGPDETGQLIYVKSSLTGTEPPYVLDYKRSFPSFPHESTADQFFGEAQFEAYRALGYHAMMNATPAIATALGPSAVTAPPYAYRIAADHAQTV